MNQKYQKPLPFEGPNLGRKGSSSLLRFCKNLLLHTCIMPIVNSKICGKRLFKFLATSGLVALVIYIYVTKHPCCQFARTLLFEDPLVNFDSPTNLNHTVFAISGSRNTWTNRRWYVEAWWRPNKTRGYVFMDEAPIEHLPWPSSSPPLRIPDNNSSLPTAIRMLRIIEDAFKEESKGEVRWFVMADDDTFLLVDNLMEVLSKYDHGKYFYIGMSSECVAPNWITSFEMAFGGAGFALSYPLAKSLAKNMDSCIERYHPTLLRSDHMLQSCIADLGVPLTKEKGFHQMDFHGDISGFLSAHPQTPLLSLHRLHATNPIFPSMDHKNSTRNLIRAAKLDESRLLQQSICYYHIKNWSISVSWGYTVQIYQEFIPPSILHRPIATFAEWMRGAQPPFMFNSRNLPKNPCEAPNVLYFDSVGENRGNHFVTTIYTKKGSLPDCSSSRINGSFEHISKAHVLSPRRRLQTGGGSRRECCEVVELVGMGSLLGVKLRDCMKDEMVH